MTIEIGASNSLTEAQQHLEQAYEHEEKAELDAALRECEQAIYRNPNLAEAHNLRGLILEQLGQKEQAIAAYSEAVRLDPDFEEARGNLVEAQSEILGSKQRAYQRGAFAAARWGALGYGVGFAIAGALMAVLAVKDDFAGTVQAVVLYGLASGLGAALLGKASHLQNKSRLLVIAGVLGCGLAYLVTAIPYQIFLFTILFYVSHSLETMFVVAPTIRFAIIGVCMGSMLGAVQKDWRQVRWLALAGAFGLGLFGLSNLILFDFTMFYISRFVPGSFGEATHDTILTAIILTLKGALVGGISGALLGLATGQRTLDRDLIVESHTQST